MREILFRGKRTNNETWCYGFYCHQTQDKKTTDYIFYSQDNELCAAEVVPDTVSQYTGLTDKNGKKIFEGDIVEYNISDEFDCQSIVKFGEYKQDGSGGEYSAIDCIGFYVEVDNYTCPDWCEEDSEYFPKYLKHQNLLEVASNCEVIGNIYDNPELLGGESNA